MSTNKKWLFALSLLIFFEKRFVNFNKWGKWRLDSICFPKNFLFFNPKFLFFFFSKKNNLKFAAVKKNKSIKNLGDVDSIKHFQTIDNYLSKLTVDEFGKTCSDYNEDIFYITKQVQENLLSVLTKKLMKQESVNGQNMFAMSIL